MTTVVQSFQFNLADINVFQAIEELAHNNNTCWTSFDWLNSELQTGEKEFSSLDSIKVQLLDGNEHVNELVLFGSLDWQGIFELEQKLIKNQVNVTALGFCKPSKTLKGAVKFALASDVSNSYKLELVEWAEAKQLELCITNQAPSINEPGLLVMDMDSTAIQIECIDEIAKLAGVGEQVAEVTAAAMRGELDFAESLRARVGTLKDAPVSIIDEVANNLPLMPGLTELVEALQAKNWKLVVASGGFTYMTEKLKEQLNLDKTVANQLEMADGKLTGQVLGGIVDAQVKADTVEALSEEWGIPMSQTVAMGDGANDLVMMAAANLGVAFHAKPLVRQKADTSIREGSLEQLLYIIS